MREVPMYRTFDGREWEDYKEAVVYSKKKFAEKYDAMTLTEARSLAEEDETLKEFLRDILYRSTEVVTRYKIDQIPRGLFEAVDGARFSNNEAARSHEDAIIDEVIQESSAQELLGSLVPQISMMVRSSIAENIAFDTRVASNAFPSN